MENKKGLIIAVVILGILVVGLGGYVIYSNIQKNKTNDTVTTDNEQTNDENKESLSKLEASKDWIYDATYEKNVTSDSYSTYYDTYYAKNIVVPYINIDSTDATKANTEIKTVFDKAISSYNEGVKDKTTYVDQCNYKKYTDDSNASVVLTLGIGGTDVVHPVYYTYNLSLKTGKALTYAEVYELAGLTSSNVEAKVTSAITTAVKDKMKQLDEDSASYVTKSVNNYKASVTNNTVKYFVDENKKLNVIVTLSIPVGTESFDTIITVD